MYIYILHFISISLSVCVLYCWRCKWSVMKEATPSFLSFHLGHPFPLSCYRSTVLPLLVFLPLCSRIKYTTELPYVCSRDGGGGGGG
jgi:hypothetical protein